MVTYRRAIEFLERAEDEVPLEALPTACRSDAAVGRLRSRKTRRWAPTAGALASC